MIPRVSVVMTVYNGLPYLREAVDSVLAQTLRDIELVAVDDASTDGSTAYLQGCRDPRLRLHRNERNLGQTRSLNLGLQMARAPSVARLDQDDIALPDRLRRQVEVLDRRPEVAVVGTWMREMDERGRLGGRLGRCIDNYGTLIGCLLVGVGPLCHPSVMYRRRVVVEALGGYDEAFAPAEDFELWTRMALQRHRAVVMPEPLTLYRVHEGQQSARKLAVQRQQVRLAQERFVAAWCPSQQLHAVSAILAGDGAVWDRRASTPEFVAPFEALRETLRAMLQCLCLSAAERQQFRQIVTRWLGPGVWVAPSLSRWPLPAVRLVIGLLSPLLVPHVRPALAGLRRSLQCSVGWLS